MAREWAERERLRGAARATRRNVVGLGEQASRRGGRGKAGRRPEHQEFTDALSPVVRVRTAIDQEPVLIELVLRNGRRVRVSGAFDGEVIARAIRIAEGSTPC